MRDVLDSGTAIEIVARDGAARGVVVAPDIMGLRPLFDDHVARLADEHGWSVVAVEPFPGREDLPLEDRLNDRIDVGANQRDLIAAADLLGTDRVAIIGFCMGGSVAFLAACRLNGLSCAIAYYGGQIAKFADEKPKVPVQMHFGEKDQGIPMTDVEAIKKKQPQAEIYTYPDAPHGFHCDERASFTKSAAEVAWPRALDFLKKHVKK